MEAYVPGSQQVLNKLIVKKYIFSDYSECKHFTKIKKLISPILKIKKNWSQWSHNRLMYLAMRKESNPLFEEQLVEMLARISAIW